LKLLLAEPREKLRRAEHHCDDLREKIDQWVASRSQTPLPFTGAFENAQSRFVYRIGDFVRDLPADWPLIIGDALTNYRAALDYLAWGLVSIRPNPEPIRRENKIQFPLIWNWAEGKTGRDRFAAEVPNRLPGVDSAYVEIVEGHQPYQWGLQDASTRSDSVNDYYAAHVGRVERHPLALLDRLCNHDKHRQLQVVGELPVHISAEVVEQVGCEVVSLEPIKQERLYPGAELVHVYVKRLTLSQPHLTVRISVDIVPAFDASIFVNPALEPGLVLEVIGSEVRRILDDVAAVAEGRAAGNA
jgi:hypothetical protein